MAKHGVEVHEPDKDEMMRYQAEDMAREAMKETPEYKAMVENAMHHLREAQKEMKGMGKMLPKKKGVAEHGASVPPPKLAKVG